ncbi:hypothetical protein ACIBG8_40065 [Nonomuraea sp. NPDC050556]|uniref:hypothetical protein n=1 Tax=Nonomuraea sp. NPDC050556 TaxID=3364369 RepID=UPI0037AC9847
MGPRDAVLPYSPPARGPQARTGPTTRPGNDPLGDALYGENDRSVVTAPIVGATRPQHISDAVASLDVCLDEAEVASMESPYRPHPVLGM